MAPLLSSRRSLAVALISVVAVAQIVLASKTSEKHAAEAANKLSLSEIDHELEKCSVVQALNRASRLSTSPAPSYLSHIFSLLFPSSRPAINALLATAYISGPPNFLLALCPPNIDPSSLSLMVAFAVGGLMGDTIFHLLPEIFLGEVEGDGVKFVLVEPNRNLLLGVGILVGFAAFMALERTLRILTGGGGHDHAHGSPTSGSSRAEASGVEVNGSGELKKRGKKGKDATTGNDAEAEDSVEEKHETVKLGGYLNLIADFTHNITDGLALSTSFYTSPTLGATTTLAVFFHEIPHEVGDFALLIQSGFSKRAALGAQFLTAIGAFLGTFIGIAVQEWGSGDAGLAAGVGGRTGGIWGTSLSWGDMLLPFTAGTFLYVGTVAVIPELLELKDGGKDKTREWKRMGGEFVAMAVGAGIMLFISWS